MTNSRIDLPAFFETIGDDPRITVTHISLYLSMFSEWEQERKEFFELSREHLMKRAKISARSTYEKTLGDLHNFGYIFYERGRGLQKGKIRFNRLV